MKILKAAEKGNLHVVGKVLEASDVDVNAVNFMGLNSLQLATQNE